MDLVCKTCNELFDGKSSFINHFMDKHVHVTFKHGNESMDANIHNKYKNLTPVPCSSSICVCEICFKSTVDIQSLAHHIMTHVGAMPYFCETCDFSTISKLHLKQHLLRHMDETSKRMISHYNFEDVHECEGCDSNFPTWKDLVCHYVQHLKAMPFTCKECNMMFCAKREYAIHNHLHKCSLICDICQEFFNTRVKFLLHVLSHDTSKYFSKFSAHIDVKSVGEMNQVSNAWPQPSSGYDRTHFSIKKPFFMNVHENMDFGRKRSLAHKFEEISDKNYLKRYADYNGSPETRASCKRNIPEIRSQIEFNKVPPRVSKTTYIVKSKNAVQRVEVNKRLLRSTLSSVENTKKDKRQIGKMPKASILKRWCRRKKKTEKSLLYNRFKAKISSKDFVNESPVGKEYEQDNIKDLSVVIERLPSYVKDMPSYLKYLRTKMENGILQKKNSRRLRASKNATLSEQHLTVATNTSDKVTDNRNCSYSEKFTDQFFKANSNNCNCVVCNYRSIDPNFFPSYMCDQEKELVQSMKQVSVVLERLPKALVDKLSNKNNAGVEGIETKPQCSVPEENKTSINNLKVCSDRVNNVKSLKVKCSNKSVIPKIVHSSNKTLARYWNMRDDRVKRIGMTHSTVKRSNPVSKFGQVSLLRNHSNQLATKPFKPPIQKPIEFSNVLNSKKKRIGTKSNYLKQMTAQKLIRTSLILKGISESKNVNVSQSSKRKTVIENYFTCKHKEIIDDKEKSCDKSNQHNSIFERNNLMKSLPDVSESDDSSTDSTLSSESTFRELIHLNKQQCDISSPSDDSSSSETTDSSDEMLEEFVSEHPKTQQTNTKSEQNKKKKRALSDILPFPYGARPHKTKRQNTKLINQNSVSTSDVFSRDQVKPTMKSKDKNSIRKTNRTRPKFIKKQISDIRKNLERFKLSRRFRSVTEFREVVVELCKLPDSIYEKHVKGKPIMLSNMLPILQSVRSIRNEKLFKEVLDDHNYSQKTNMNDILNEHNYSRASRFIYF